MRRNEIADLGEKQESEQPKQGSPANIPQRLTFYDVVQLAREQAFAEKTRKRNENLIDISESQQSINSPVTSKNASDDHSLHELMASQQSEPSQKLQHEDEAHKPNENAQLLCGHSVMAELDANNPVMAELDASSSQSPALVDLLGLVELPASQPTEKPVQMPFELPDSSQALTQHVYQAYRPIDATQSQLGKADAKFPPPERVVLEESSASGLSIQEKSEISASLATIDPPRKTYGQNGASLLDQDDGTDAASFSTAPSIFSHLSMSTGGTVASLLGISERDLQSRNTSLAPTKSSVPISPPTLARRPTLGSIDSSINKNLVSDNDAEGIYSASTLSAQEAPSASKPQLLNIEDSLSVRPSLTQIPNIDEPDQQGFPWIVQAARDGNEEMIRKLLASEADVTASHKSTKRHALSEAAFQGHNRVVDLLIEAECPLDQADVEGNTALHHACRKGYFPVVKSLLAGGAPINAVGPDGQTALHVAMQTSRQNVVMLLLQHNASINARDTSHQTPLHIGAGQGNVAMCKYLLDEGAHLDSRQAQSKTPLQLACEAGHYQMVHMMLNQAQLHPTNMTFLGAFFAAVEHGQVRIAEYFFPHGLNLKDLKRDIHKPITLAAKSGYLDMVDLMIHQDCIMEARDEYGWNALHVAAFHGHYEIIERLIGGGVSAKAITTRKATPLLFAVREGHFATVERLLRGNTDSDHVNWKDEYGQNAVHHCVRNGSLEVFNLLMSNGGKVSSENSFGWQPLHIAIAYGHPELVERLLQQGANIEEKLGSSSIKREQTHKIVEDGYWAEARWPYPGSRPLHLACEYSHEVIAEDLISRGAKLETSCSEGWQPLHHAAYFGSCALVSTLLNGGVNPHSATNEGKTAYALGFCTSGAPIPAEDQEQISSLLSNAMERAKKQIGFKVPPMRKGSTVEEKERLLRAAKFSRDMLSKRPHMQKAKTMANSASAKRNARRPILPHQPYTTPLPSADSKPVAQSSDPLDVAVPEADEEKSVGALITMTEATLSRTETTASSENTSQAIAVRGQQVRRSSTIDTRSSASLDSTAEPHDQKIKRRTTFGLNKMKPSVDMSKLNLAINVGRSAVEVSKRTSDLGKSTREMGNKTLGWSKEVGKGGYEKSKAGFEATGKSTKEGVQKAMKFTKKGKIGGRKEGKGKGNRKEGVEGDPSVESAENGKKNGEGSEEENEDNDSKSETFSLGDFAEYGNKDF